MLAISAAPAPRLARSSSRTNSCCPAGVYRKTQEQQPTYFLWQLFSQWRAERDCSLKFGKIHYTGSGRLACGNTFSSLLPTLSAFVFSFAVFSMSCSAMVWIALAFAGLSALRAVWILTVLPKMRDFIRVFGACEYLFFLQTGM
ncbi:hypothetical protein P153DRAFT_115029 [Dothidotthia symphoricarpi CBS 119687]|uniref:Uncharacterized protein n=1 Tax=Dothidotthia symphoricarpi CBS 119687 TaxID=1392245 RepID=A0A6A6A0J6_9PLEO|nr:uncharacterized protein P153DRAFT_115029 [Dothidotthia symphoricarpi CBS 119687]KAF2125522.1 hypothetical protein P153DRAFT_115029 [Dothidotthia symphoricarpi CBS 119687]